MDGYLQTALREMRRLFTRPGFLGGWLATAIIVAIVGPYGTAHSLTPFVRIAYWAMVVSFGFVIAAFATAFIIANEKLVHLPGWLRISAGALLIGCVIGLLLSVVNPLVWADPEGLPSLLDYWLITVPVSFAISFALAMARRGRAEAITGVTTEQEGIVREPISPFLKRLPLTIGKQLYSVSVQDHYLEAYTAIGSHMLLMRFGDALDELDAIDGMRIHRSHWVAMDGVAETRKSGERLIIVLKDGRELPVSRTYLAEVRSKLQL